MLTSTGGPSTCLVLSVSSNSGKNSMKMHNLAVKTYFFFYSVYARMEDLNEDSLYFFLKSGLISRVSFNQKLNSAHSVDSTEQR